MNHLAQEKSPYLLQHADNPVDWYPWGEAAFDKARQEGKPIFLSIGYATCHWCHVMAEESFADAEVAERLNQDFVSVKVDREERPDVDSLYMDACLAMTGSGGWPLTILMDADGHPFYAATYLPKRGAYGRPGLLSLLEQAAALWRERPERLADVQAQVLQTLQSEALRPGARTFQPEDLNAAKEAFAEHYDADWGGFSPAPKFPTPQNLLFLLRLADARGDADALAMAQETFLAMTRGGLYDHVGGGFARYSTDGRWLVPHFEKMLYDNALLILVAVRLHQATGDPWVRYVAEHSAAWLLREMRSEGGFASAQDADAQGVEGAYYVLTPEAVRDALGDDAPAFCDAYGIVPGGHFEGQSIANRLHEQVLTVPDASLRDALDRLRRWRAARMPLGRDDKVLLGWNALAIQALASLAQMTGDATYADAAWATRQFLDRNLKDAAGRHLLRYRDGDARIRATAEDLAFLAEGDLALYRLNGAGAHLAQAIAVADELLEHYRDAHGGLYLTADDAEALAVRPRSDLDGAMPSASSAAVGVFDRLFALTGELRWRDARDGVLQRFSALERLHPLHAGYLYHHLVGVLLPRQQLLVCGPDTALPQDLSDWLGRNAALSLDILRLGPDNDEEIKALAPFTRAHSPGAQTEYILCSDGTCTRASERWQGLLNVDD